MVKMLSACCVFVILLKHTYTYTNAYAQFTYTGDRKKEEMKREEGRRKKERIETERDGRRGKQQTQFP